MPLLSIITPHFNMPETIIKAVESIPVELSDMIEHIIIDDCSTDGSYCSLQSLAESYEHIKLFQNSANSGPIITINKGAELASGDYLIFLSADDWLDKNFLIKFLETVKNYNLPGLVLGDVCIYYEDNDSYRRIKSFAENSPRLYERPAQILSTGLISRLHGQAALRRDLFIQFGSYDLDLRWNSDLYLHSKIALSHGVLYLPVVHGYFAKRANSYGNSKTYEQQGETLDKLMLLFLEPENTDVKKLYIESGCLGREIHTLKYLVQNKEFKYLTMRYFIIRLAFTTVRSARSITKSIRRRR